MTNLVNKIKNERLNNLINAKKIMILMHTDLDGAGAVVLAKSMMPDKIIDYRACSNNGMSNAIENYVVNYFDNNDYDFIIACDISCDKFVAEKIEARSKNKNHFILLDHHQTAKDLNDMYSWAIITDTMPLDTVLKYNGETNDKISKKHISGTGLLFEYLNHMTNCNLAQKRFARLVSDYDTWDWKNTECEDQNCKDLNDLMYIYSYDNFVDIMIDRCKSDSEIITELDNTLLKIERNRIKNDVDKIIKGVKTGVANLANAANRIGKYYSIAIACTDNHIPDVFERMRVDYADRDILMILTSSSLSMRTDKPDVNVGEIAKAYGGGGHAAAAGIPIGFEERLEMIENRLGPDTSIFIEKDTTVSNA